jgi:WD repeat-containing protein 89
VNIYAPSFPVNEDDALVEVKNHGSSIHCAGFLPQYPVGDATEESIIYALSHDETLSFYKREESANSEHGGETVGAMDADSSVKAGKENEILAFGDVRPLLGCEYVVDILSEDGEPYIVVGSHTYV